MSLTNYELGKLGEDFAAEWFSKNGYLVLSRNWRGKKVELDLVLAKNDMLIFVEVKTRSSISFGYPAEAVTKANLKNIKSAAMQWLSVNKFKAIGFRIDIMSLQFDGKEFTVNHLVGVD